MNKEEIMKCIPHRKDMLILDEATVEGGSARGKYLVRGTEFFLNEHYPQKRIVPGTILCEIMAQLLAVCVSQRTRGMPVLAKIEEASFKKMVLPGDNLDIYVETLSESTRVIPANCEIKVLDEVCASAKLTVASLISETFDVF